MDFQWTEREPAEDARWVVTQPTPQPTQVGQDQRWVRTDSIEQDGVLYSMDNGAEENRVGGAEIDGPGYIDTLGDSEILGIPPPLLDANPWNDADRIDSMKNTTLGLTACGSFKLRRPHEPAEEP